MIGLLFMRLAYQGNEWHGLEAGSLRGRFYSIPIVERQFNNSPDINDVCFSKYSLRRWHFKRELGVVKRMHEMKMQEAYLPSECIIQQFGRVLTHGSSTLEALHPGHELA